MSRHTFLRRSIHLSIFSSFVDTIDFFVATHFTSTLCCVCCDIKLLCHDKVVLPCIVDFEFCVATELFFAIFSSLCRDKVLAYRVKALSSGLSSA